MEAKDPKSSETSTGDTESSLAREPDSDATSDETLDELESEEETAETQDQGEGHDMPSPDGAFDDGRGEANPEPM